MKIDLSQLHPTRQHLLQSRGVPSSIFSQSFELAEVLDKCEYQNNGNLLRERVESQIKGFNQIIKKPLDKPYLYCVGTLSQELVAQAIALTIFNMIVTLHLSNPDQVVSTPFWYSVFGGYHDKLRDEKEFRAALGPIPLLVIDNIAANSTPYKIEKIRDLHRIYQDIPIILIVAGMNPWQFCFEHLFLRPDKILYIGHKVTRI